MEEIRKSESKNVGQDFMCLFGGRPSIAFIKCLKVCHNRGRGHSNLHTYHENSGNKHLKTHRWEGEK